MQHGAPCCSTPRSASLYHLTCLRCECEGVGMCAPKVDGVAWSALARAARIRGQAGSMGRLFGAKPALSVPFASRAHLISRDTHRHVSGSPWFSFTFASCACSSAGGSARNVPSMRSGPLRRAAPGGRRHDRSQMGGLGGTGREPGRPLRAPREGGAASGGRLPLHAAFCMLLVRGKPRPLLFSGVRSMVTCYVMCGVAWAAHLRRSWKCRFVPDSIDLDNAIPSHLYTC